MTFLLYYTIPCMYSNLKLKVRVTKYVATKIILNTCMCKYQVYILCGMNSLAMQQLSGLQLMF